MSRSKRTGVQKYHDRVAHRYDESYDDVFWQWHDALTWDYLKPFLPRDQRAKVYDLGCGTGKWGAKLIKSGFSVTFVDISPQMLDRARAKIGEMGSLDRAKFVQADLCDLSALPKADASLAVAFGEPICCATLPPKAMREIRRLLCDDGLLVATIDNRLAAIDFYLQRGDTDEMVEFLRKGQTHWLTKSAEEQFPITTYGPTELRTLVEKSGFVLDDMVGKTVLPMRHYRQLLDDPTQRRGWARIEKKLSRDPGAVGRAAHLQVVCRAV